MLLPRAPAPNRTGVDGNCLRKEGQRSASYLPADHREKEHQPYDPALVRRLIIRNG
jgi:hypothetical protein